MPISINHPNGDRGLKRDRPGEPRPQIQMGKRPVVRLAGILPSVSLYTRDPWLFVEGKGDIETVQPLPQPRAASLEKSLLPGPATEKTALPFLSAKRAQCRHFPRREEIIGDSPFNRATGFDIDADGRAGADGQRRPTGAMAQIERWPAFQSRLALRVISKQQAGRRLGNQPRKDLAHAPATGDKPPAITLKYEGCGAVGLISRKMMRKRMKARIVNIKRPKPEIHR